ncbi:MAG: beta-galactosidase [Verrucomicrobia bacterium]|nr:beta-galactosidase [Verrucomicrobiota bacterium]
MKFKLLAPLRKILVWIALPLFLLLRPPAHAADGGFLQMKNGYFWDPAKGEYFIPRGIAYQVWNPPVGANQSFEQLDYDLLEFKKMYCNSVRCEIVWGEVNTEDGVYDWSKPDHLIAKAEELGLKLFILVGFQYPPAWFPKAWHNVNYLGLTPEVIQCLANSTPSQALNCLPPSTALCLVTNLANNNLGVVPNCLPPVTLNCVLSQVPPALLATVQNCLVSGARAGGLSNIVSCLEADLSKDPKYKDRLPGVLGCLISDVINYEHPGARAAYQRHIAAVTARYKNSHAIGAWILGNEYAYFDLWEDPKLYAVHRFIGYDAISQTAFRAYLKDIYRGDIVALNANWLTSYANFDEVVMPPKYPDDRFNPGFHDLTQWRKQSIGDYVALGAVAARDNDPYHLRTYSMVGGIFNGRDANFTAEDAKVIVARCAKAGASLDFWAINNYANAALGDELRTADFGIGKYQEESGLPVMISETGHSSTEDLFDVPYAGLRQPKALPGQVWESLMSGAIGTHIFHWNDRSQFTRNYFLRERGFGIVEQTRRLKEPVYSNVLDMFRRMEFLRIDHLLGGSRPPRTDVNFFWSTNTDMVWPRANQEIAKMWGALKRVGLRPSIIDDRAFDAGAYTNAPALLLCRSYFMRPDQLDAVATKVLPAGVHVHADADIPGRFNAYHHTNDNWAARMDEIFGINVAKAAEGLHAIVTKDDYQAISFRGVSGLGGLFGPNYRATFKTWEIWHGLALTSGKTIVTHSGFQGAAPNTPALVIKSGTSGHGKSALNSFALSDTFLDSGVPHEPLWDFRHDWLSAIYRAHFGLQPAIDLTGVHANYVMPDYRICRDGSVLISLLNESTNTINLTLTAHSLLDGKVVENLTGSGILTTNSSGDLKFTMTGDDYVLLYAYARAGGQDGSLVNPSPNKIWFNSAPMVIRPNGQPYALDVGYDLQDAGLEMFASFELVNPPNRIYGRTDSPFLVSGNGTSKLLVPISDPDLNDPAYVSTAEGGEYVFHAWLEQSGVRVSETFLPVRLAWGARPLALPATVLPRGTYIIGVKWEDIPSYLPGDSTPASRAALWESLDAKAQHFNVILELRNATGQLMTAVTNVTTEGSGTNFFTVTVPASARGPFSWSAVLQSAPGTRSHNVSESFEGRDRGLDRTPMFPWFNYVYPKDGPAKLLSNGVLWEPAHTNVAFLIVTNPPGVGLFSGFGIVRGTTVWTLPAQASLRSKYFFTADFKEAHGLPCVLELQVKDINDNWVEFTKPYAPDAQGWDTIAASLDRFVQPLGQSQPFDRTKVRDWAFNIRMATTNAIYEGYFDNLHFTGPPDLDDDFEDRYAGEDFSRLAPWHAYGYDQTNPDFVLLDKGVHLLGSDGSQSAFIVAWNRIDSGAFAGFGLFLDFNPEWALPVNFAEWKNYSFSADFMERDGRQCVLELQLKNRNDPNCSLVQRGIHFTKVYTPGKDGWDTISATLDQFTQPDYFCPFDPSQVIELVVNVQMLEKNPTENVIYVGSIDNIRFVGPETAVAGDQALSIFSSGNDVFGELSVTRNAAHDLVISWTGAGVLQSSDSLSGSWRDVGGAKNPQTIKPLGASQFFRLRQ